MSSANYESPQLAERLPSLLSSTFSEGVVLTVEDLAGFDQFHTGGLAATVRLARLLSLAPESKVLDVGSGLGGPARYLAATYGAHVTGIDLSRSFVEGADLITSRTRLGDRVSFQHGSALELPFEAGSFDVVVMQHVAMNIADRAMLYTGIRDVLVNGGQFMTYDIIERTGAPTYPVPWSDGPDTSHLLTESATREALESAGFAITIWEVAGPEAAAAFLPSLGLNPPPLATMLGRPNFGQAIANVSASLAEGRIAVLTAVMRKTV